ncbi:MAG TPA: bifunctional tetrahydrofolate synthase/dihydrofolate synthase [Legionella sp.]|nr:bifunctional tetrahydrofolate synthase/dihydrofolate synthase [Legionella sp.]
MSKLSNDWDLNQWLYYLEHRPVQEIQLGLTRIKAVAQKLNLLNPSYPVITVAGTNGKGSTVAALEQIYCSAGYNVGVYTSPHLIQFNDRIKINLNSISDNQLCQAFRLIDEARDEIVLTYFEITTLAALWYFQQQPLDVVILEVGLGGRLDATNLIDAELAVITTIDYDHQDYLGTTLEKIGEEKAGILRQGKPLIYADLNPPSTILNKAQQLNCPTYLFGSHYNLLSEGSDWEFYFQKLHIPHLPRPHIQLKSAAAAILASLLLSYRLPVNVGHIYPAMRDVFIPGRLQLIPGNIDLLFDVSHNPQSARLLAEHIKSLNIKGKIHAVFSALKDKDISGLIFPLKHCVDRWYPAQLDNKRAASADLLSSLFVKAEICVEICYTSPLLAFEEALKSADTGDLVVVFGSFHTVGEVMTTQYNLLDQRRFNETGNG